MTRRDAIPDGAMIVVDDPDNGCFGCSPHNHAGLRLAWRRTGDGAVETTWTGDGRWDGSPGVVHGGVQAALLDETMGMAIHEAAALPEDAAIATADFELHYRRPARSGEPLVLRARLLRVEGRDLFVEGEIRDRAGTLLTCASARWRRLRPPAAEAVAGAAPGLQGTSSGAGGSARS